MCTVLAGPRLPCCINDLSLRGKSPQFLGDSCAQHMDCLLEEDLNVYIVCSNVKFCHSITLSAPLLRQGPSSFLGEN